MLLHVITYYKIALKERCMLLRGDSSHFLRSESVGINENLWKSVEISGNHLESVVIYTQ